MLGNADQDLPRPEKWLWDMLEFPSPASATDWFSLRFGFLKTAFQEGAYRRESAIAPALGAKSRLAAVEVDGGRDLKYVIVYARELPPSWRPGIQETLTYRSDVAGTDLVYDLTGEFMQGKARPFLGDFRELPLRVYAVLPFQLERIDLAAMQHVTIGDGSEPVGTLELPWRLRFLDGRGEPLSATVPYFIEVRHLDRKLAHGKYRSTNATGELPASLAAAVRPHVGSWTVAVRSLLTGVEATLPLRVSSGDRKREQERRDAVLTSRGLQCRRSPQPVTLNGPGQAEPN